MLVEDASSPSNRIYEFQDSKGNAVALLGSELESLLDWWKTERNRHARKA